MNRSCALLLAVVAGCTGDRMNEGPDGGRPEEAAAAVDIELATKIVADAGLFDQDEGKTDLMFALDAVEPAKADIGKPWPRMRRFQVLRRPELTVIAGTCDLDAKRVVESREIKDVDPWLTDGEFDDILNIALADERVKAELKRRGVTPDRKHVKVDQWATGGRSEAAKKGERLARGLFFRIPDDAKCTYYAQPIEGLSVLMDLAKGEVIAVESEKDAVPVSGVNRPLASTVTSLQPLETAMPKGVSFTCDGNAVTWWKWSLRWSFNAREGLVIHAASFDGRSVLGRGSVSEIAVPYAPTDRTWRWRCAMDEGEYGLGRCSTPLSKGRSVPEYARVFPAVLSTEAGEADERQGVVAIYERARGPLWMHNEQWPQGSGHGATPIQQDRELVLCTLATIGNYDYLFEWSFSLAGAIRFRACLNGILLSAGTKDASCPDCAGAKDQAPLSRELVDRNIAAPLHEHLFSVRLDMDVDGVKNTVVEERPGGGVEGASYYSWRRTGLRSEQDALTDAAGAPAFGWRVENREKTTALGHHPAYRIAPLSPYNPVIAKGDAFPERAWFTRHPIAVTRLAPDQLFAAGDFVLSDSPGGTLEKWVADNQPIDGEDVVCWVSLSAVHLPCPEQWPIMPAVTVGVDLLPDGFLAESPTAR